MLTKKQCELLQLLTQTKEVMSSEQISSRLDLSTKTIQRYVELINQYLEKYDVEIISMRGYGFVLQGNMKVVEELITNLSSDDYDRRIKDITRYLLSKEYITIEEIGEILSYSTSTLNKLIPEVKKYLALYNLSLISKPYYGVSVAGDELNIRDLMIDCSFIKNNYDQLCCLIENISEEEFQTIRDATIDFLYTHKIVIADDDVSDLMMRITLIISRCKQNCLLDSLEYVEEENLIQQLLQDIAVRINILIPLSEVCYLSMYYDIINSILNDSQSLLQEDISEFVVESLNKMQRIYSKLIIQDSVRESLILHLNLMMNRLNHKHYSKNGLLQDIKANYILEMNYAITFGKLIEERFHIKVPEDELGYLALYFALSDHKQKKVKRVIILCNYGIATSQLIREQIKERFPQLEVVGIYPLYYLEVVMNQDIDLIISTVALDETKVTKPLIVIKQFLDEDTFSHIKQVIDDPEDTMLFQYFNKRAFFRLNTKNKQDTLSEMSKRMVSLGFFHQATIDKIMEREKISSTDIGNLIAIPHAIIENDQKSVIGIGILEKPITWDKEKVQIVFLTGLNANDAEKNNVFRHLYRIIKDVSNVNYLIANKSFESFKKIF
jgi:lichenan operon transcriptional antiterminator